MEQSELNLERSKSRAKTLMSVNDVTIYEQPLNELTRVFLRLEQLFKETDHNIIDTSPAGTRKTVVTIINLLQLLERPDLKAKLAKELSLKSNSLARLKSDENVDQQKLCLLLDQLNELRKNFIASSNKIAQNLREIELLKSLRLHLSTPGGGGNFDTPLFYYWLQQPELERLTTLKSWLTSFEDIRLASHLLLKLLREESRNYPKTANKGFYQEPLDPQNSLRLIRVMLAPNWETFPEISLSRHFMSIRYFTPNVEERPTQYKEDIDFWLAYCNV